MARLCGSGFTAILCCFIVALNVLDASTTSLQLSISVLQPSTNFMLPLGSSTGLVVSVVVDWGDGINSTHTTASYNGVIGAYFIEHLYATTGNYSVIVDRFGSGPVWLSRLGWGGSIQAWSSMPNITLLNVTSFGDLGTVTLGSLFRGLSVNFSVPQAIPATVTDLNRIFESTALFNQSIDSWNVSAVTSMVMVFKNTQIFNQPLGSWDVSSVTTMQEMFYGAKAFNQPIGSWNVSSVTTMLFLFYSATAFNQPIGSWDVSNVRDFSYLFYGTNFNQPINSWNTGKATSMANMFNGAAFNLPIGSWDVSKVTDMNMMFRSAPAFNQPIGAWDVGNVTTMNFMFQGTPAFNQPIGSWDMRKVTSLQYMFNGAQAFNQPLDAWNVSAVRLMTSTFASALKFNQSLGSWNVSSVTDMNSMFSSATAFSYPLLSWCVPQITTRPTLFANGSGLSLNNEPIWGTCPVVNQPSSTAAPTLPTQGCSQISKPTSGNVSCANGQWVLYTDATIFDGTVVVVPGVKIIVSGTTNVKNTTIVVQLGGPQDSSPGIIELTDCATLGGTVTFQLQSGAVVRNNDRVLVISSLKPECFTTTMTTRVDGSCASVVTTKPVVDYNNGRAELYVLFSANAPEVSADACVSSPVIVPSGVVAGVVVAVILTAIILAASVYLYRKRRHERERAALKAQLAQQHAR